MDGTLEVTVSVVAGVSDELGVTEETGFLPPQENNSAAVRTQNKAFLLFFIIPPKNNTNIITL